MLSSPRLLKQAQRQVFALQRACVQQPPLRKFAAASKKDRRKYEIPGLGEYSDLFEESRIMEKLLPRQLTDGADFEGAYPSIL